MEIQNFFKRNNIEIELSFVTSFDSNSENESFEMLKNFLLKEGYGDIPLPANARRLWWDYLRPDQDGNFGNFIWFPIIIGQNAYQMYGLGLTIFNEDYPDHLTLWEEMIAR